MYYLLLAHVGVSARGSRKLSYRTAHIPYSLCYSGAEPGAETSRMIGKFPSSQTAGRLTLFKTS